METTCQKVKLSQSSTTKPQDYHDTGLQKFYAISASSCSSGGDISLKIKSVESKESGCKLAVSSSTMLNDESDVGDDLRSVNSGLSSIMDSKRKKCRKFNVKLSPQDLGSKLKSELCKYKDELKDYNNITKDLEEKYIKLNVELNDMQQKHEHFIAERKSNTSKGGGICRAMSFSGSSSSVSGSEYSLQRKSTQVFRKRINNSASKSQLSTKSKQLSAENITIQYSTANELKKRIKKSSSSAAKVIGAANASTKRLKPRTLLENNKENIRFNDSMSNINCVSSIKELCSVVHNVLHANRNESYGQKDAELMHLQSTVSTLQCEHEQFKSIIKQQQSCLQDYQTRCLKAQHLMKTQQNQIKKLNTNNHQLESEITTGIDQLRSKIDTKLKDISQLPHLMRSEQVKYEKISKENTALSERLRNLQSEAHQLKLKIEELGQRKLATINRLKNAERDLKIFKNYNTALKHEKRKLSDELQKVKVQLDNIQNSSKRTLSRQREQNEKLRRDLQKRVFELELKLSRSKNSTTNLIQERDSLIAELQTQLNTLVHNFEVSQKHIRVLRRHIYTMTATGNVSVNTRLSNETI